MGLLKMFVEDMKSAIPEEIKYYEDKETGEVAFQIINKPNRFVPTHIRSYSNKKIFVYEATSRKPKSSDVMLIKKQPGNE